LTKPLVKDKVRIKVNDLSRKEGKELATHTKSMSPGKSEESTCPIHDCQLQTKELGNEEKSYCPICINEPSDIGMGL